MPPQRRRPVRLDPNDLTGQRAGLYCRVSRDNDSDDRAIREKSVDDQEAVGREWAAREKVVLAAGWEPAKDPGIYRDSDRSASRFANKEREQFEQLLKDVKAGKLDLVWFWELSRSQRDLAVFVPLRNLCRDMGVRWVIGTKVYDPAEYADMMALGVLSLAGEMESEQTSERVTRGKKSSAYDGRPAGRTPYGYKRIWHPETGLWDRDEPNVFDGDGRAVEDSPAYVVREIFDRIKAGHSITSIRRDLNDRGIPASAGGRWANSGIRYIAMNPTYAGMRVYHIEKGAGLSTRASTILEGVEVKWPPLVDTDTFWTVYRLLADPARTTSRPHRPGGRLLSAVARCGECGARLTLKLGYAKQGHRADLYTCADKGCVGIYVPGLDDHVEKVMVRWLSDPDVAAALASNGDAGAAALARADAGKARAELGDWRLLAERGEITPAGYAAAEKGLLARIADADQRIQDATMPPVLAGNIGPRAAAGWKALDTPIKRQIIAAVADIRVLRVGRHGNRLIPAADRVTWRWLLGPATDEDTEAGSVQERIRAREAARLAERRAKVAHLRADGWTRQAVAEELGVTVATVKKDIAAGTG